ncbi:MAG TPA: DUF4389 domain-containing protein [Solirubrobacterales bacterium]|jgi:hypothetical protein|nr:DUF4389 domain-containing protein [Solirubrobacterales bacterium]
MEFGVDGVEARPVRLVVSDDLQRGRGSVFFRLWFALPFLLWLTIWGLAAFFVAIANWFATLFSGTSPRPLHGFLARFIRFAVHVYAYLYLAAEPLPGFSGRPGYPIDVEIDPPVRQNRWKVGFRLVLVVPSLFLLAAFFGSSGGFNANSGGGEINGIGLLVAAAFLGWFFALARGRIPRGMRDLIAYGLSYAAQAWAYMTLLTDRYPSSDPLTAIGPLPVREDPVRLESSNDLRRSRLTVFFRLLLAIPHLIWLTLWGIVALLAAIGNWFATLSTGTSPAGLHRFLAAYMRYQLHVFSYLYLVGNPFPGFTGERGSYPIELRIAERARQNRWSVGFRVVLALPALLIASAYGTLVFTVAFLGWFASLFTGTMPLGLRNAGALALRYGAQTYGYLFMVSGAYPYSGPNVAPRPADA